MKIFEFFSTNNVINIILLFIIIITIYYQFLFKLLDY